MSKFFKKFKIALSNDGAFDFHKDLIITSHVKGLIFGVYIENLPKGIRIWDFLSPSYNVNFELNFQYSKISKFKFISDDVLKDKLSQIEIVNKVICYIRSKKNLEYIFNLNLVEDMDVDELSKLRFNFLFCLYNHQYDKCLKLKKSIEEISEDICSFDWWRDTLCIWDQFLKDPDIARNILLNREKEWIDALSSN